MSVLVIRPKNLTIHFESYKSRNRFSKARVQRYRQRLQVGVHEWRNRQQKEVAAMRKAHVRAETERLWASWPGLGRIWSRSALAGRPDCAWCRAPVAECLGATRVPRCVARLGAQLLGSPGLGAPRLVALFVGSGWLRSSQREEKRKEKKEEERRRRGKEEERREKKERGRREGREEGGKMKVSGLSDFKFRLYSVFDLWKIFVKIQNLRFIKTN